MKNIFKGLEIYRITYGDEDSYTYEGEAYTTLEEAKAALLELANQDREDGAPWWRCTWRRVEKFDSDSRFEIWEDEAWDTVWGDDDLEEVFPKFGEDEEDDEDEEDED